MSKDTEAEGEVGSEASATSAERPSNSKSKSKNNPKTSKHSKVDHESKEKVAKATPPPPTPSPSPMPVSRTIPLLICGIGNPGSTYANTLHSAGLTILNRLAERLGYSNFQKDRSLGNGLVTRPDISGGESGDWTLWQSTSYMNDSGKGVRAAWMNWSRSIAEGEARLVVVYDELEKPLGTVTMKTNQGASAKGHNGLKSIMAVMGNTPFARIGVGIGRPESRESDDVARYVLRKMTPGEKGRVEEAVEEVVRKLKQLEKG